MISSKIDHYQIKKPPTPHRSKVQLTSNARIVLEKRYLRKNEKGELIETPEQLFERVAKAIVAPDKAYGEKDIREIEEKFYDMLSQLEFLPNSPTLMNAGTDLGQLSACFVLPIEDSMDSIFETLKHTALIQKSGGGTGFNFSKLRPKNSAIKTTQGTSSGPLSFISVFNSVTDTIKQGGTRRGANMAILNVDHPDILEFIHSKETPGALINFNISVAVTEKFMELVKKNETYPLIDPTIEKVVGSLNARDVFSQITEAAWKTGDPGIIFIDRINNTHQVPNAGTIESTNPCGEQILLPYESCNLGSINLNTVMNGKDIDWKKLEELTKTAVHFLDNVIDANAYPLPQIEKITKANRTIGLGVMGLADILIQKNIPYDSEEALKVSEEVISFIRTQAHEASQALAQKRGAFPNFKGSLYDKAGQKPLRNATVITIAPTGTLSLIAGCSSGIEPLFAKSYVRHVLEGEALPETHTGEALKTAHEISLEWHVRMQALFQKYSDNAVSKTVNLPHSATIEDVRKVYWLAYELSCKGITIYRDRSK
ncbi:MAG: adenosylcobalamin-dependent ribonucleoside-diphosphate reductase, partial [Deltaproteobacteria bacterium]|nr:adenosylcobalamin-dependent ribonucleoside-diphosphate reductase [Deltaproteobacteria bacterium]